MSRGPENTFIASVHRHLPVDLYAMKNHNQYNGGVADCWYSGGLGDLWVEYKFIVVPKRGTTLIDLCGGKDPAISALQQEWLRDRHLEGRNVAVVVGCKNGGVVLEDRSWELPFTTQMFIANTTDRKSVASWISGRTYG